MSDATAGSKPDDRKPEDGKAGGGRTGFVIVQLAPQFAWVERETLAAAADAASLTALARIFKTYDSPPSERLVRTDHLEDLRKLEKRARERVPGRADVSLASFWRVDLREQRHRIDEVIAELRNDKDLKGVVVTAYADSPAAAPAAVTRDPHSQQYFDAADVGIDADFAWAQPGGDGANVGVAIIDMNWRFTHQDLVGTVLPQQSFGDLSPAAVDVNHGTASTAIIVGKDNGLGIVGIAPAANPVLLVSHFVGGLPTHTAAAVTWAAAPVPGRLSEGDVIVLEVQTAGSVADGIPAGYPIEIKLAERVAIKTATDAGIIVIEPAGNANVDLGTWAPGFPESGAIMVGAATSDLPHRRWIQTWLGFPSGPGSNWGTRVNCYAWGEDVTTAGKDSEFVACTNTDYAYNFNATSAATAIIGGAAVVIQSIAKAAGQLKSPAEMRTLLSNLATGTPVSRALTDPTSVPQPTGAMPNLRRLLLSQNWVADVYLRDAVGDIGQVPSSGAVGDSPDIIVRSQQVADPAGSYGQNSGQADSPSLGGNAAANQNNYIYVRMKNRGGVPSLNTRAAVYWSAPATLVMPADWELIGTTSPVTVPANNVLTVSPELVWPAGQVPASGHYCCVAVLASDQDPAPALPAAGDWPGFLDFITSQNNVAWKNINVVELANWQQAQRFHIVGAPDRRTFDFEVIQQLPPGARVAIEMPIDVARPLTLRGWEAERGRGDDTAKILMTEHKKLQLGRVALAGGARHVAHLMMQAEKGVNLDQGAVTLRQLYNGIEVGRITWRFVGEHSG
jgi:hypothetical protein